MFPLHSVSDDLRVPRPDRLGMESSAEECWETLGCASRDSSFEAGRKRGEREVETQEEDGEEENREKSEIQELQIWLVSFDLNCTQVQDDRITASTMCLLI